MIFWGTWFPKISEALTGTAASVGPPWFDRYTVPLALILVLLSGIGPVIAWRRATPRGVLRNLAVPCAAALLTLAALVAAGVPQKPTAHRDVLLRRLRARQRRAGAVARGPRAPRRLGRGAPGRAAGADTPQPPALRRLHRARRDGGAVHRRRRLLLLPARLPALPLSRAVHARGRLHRPLPAAHRGPHAPRRPHAHGLDAQRRRRAAGLQGWALRHHAASQRGLLRIPGRIAGLGRAPDRGAAGQQRRHRCEPHARHLERDRSPKSKPAAEAHHRSRQQARSPSRAPTRACSRSTSSPTNTSSTRRRRSSA